MQLNVALSQPARGACFFLIALAASGCPTRSARPHARAATTFALAPDTARILAAAKLDPTAIHCNSDVRWVPDLAESSKAAAGRIAAAWSFTPHKKLLKKGSRVVLGYLVRTVFSLLRPQNVGAVIVAGHRYRNADGQSRPLVVFRSAVTTDAERPGSCFRTLVGAGGVRHAINLYAGTFPLHDFIDAEVRIAAMLGVTHYDDRKHQGIRWRHMIKRPEDYAKNVRASMARVAELINRQILHPKGKAPVGNIYLHCGGGMHRTGMVFGVLRRCVNGDSMEAITAEYRRHTAYASAAQPNGAEALNLRFIREFDCTLIKR